ncbi:MAG TPA: IS1634 family transposase [Terriglobia bacterium]|nr:IS1634 family transposase [Terriglobia bacterium]
MFLRSVKAANGRHEYLRLVESFRDGDKVKQRIVAHLGRKDLLAPHLGALIRLLQDESAAPRWVSLDDISTPRASAWGPILVTRHLFEKLSLGSILDARRPPLRHGEPLSERIFPLLANRLTRPGSEHALAQWLEDFYVCNPQGRRWVPAWKQSRRVKVGFDQLKLWYRSLDDLLAEKRRIEKEVYLELRSLFSLQPDLAFYDITSTYFEGAGPAQLGRFGYSRDGKPRNRQVVIGVVMMDGWPIAHHVFAGNRLDQTTVLEVVQDLNQRFALNRVVFVGDRGMMTIGNVEQLGKMRQGYLVGLQRRNRKDTAEYIQQAEARTDWQECPLGIAASEKSLPPRTRVVEVAGKEPGVRVFVVHSEEREVYERGMRELSMGRVRKELEALQAQVEKGELKEPERMGAAAATKLRRNHGHRYFDWELRKGKFHFFEHPVNLRREKALEGKYVIQTEERNLTAVEAVTAYKELNEVERGFSHLKDLLELRPVYHHSDERVRAHVFVAALALLLDRALEKSLRAAGSGLSTPFAWQALEMIRCVELEVGQHRKICVTRGNQHVAEVLRALGITHLDPPPPPEAHPWLM